LQFVNGFGIYNYAEITFAIYLSNLEPTKQGNYVPIVVISTMISQVLRKFLGKGGSFNKNLQFLLADTFRSRADNEEASNCLLIMDRNTHL